jgi:hypothetical protein
VHKNLFQIIGTKEKIFNNKNNIDILRATTW